MNPFKLVSCQALNSGLADPDTLYLASAEFDKRVAFAGPRGLADKVAIQRYMLERVALDPKDVEGARAGLTEGFAALRFFGFCNPVAPFAVDGPGAQQLLAALEANVASPLMKGARLLRKHRTHEVMGRWFRYKDCILDRWRAQSAWPTAADFARGKEAAQLIQAQLLAALNRKAEEVLERRDKRIQRFARASAPHVGGYTAMLRDISLTVLGPQS